MFPMLYGPTILTIYSGLHLLSAYYRLCTKYLIDYHSNSKGYIITIFISCIEGLRITQLVRAQLRLLDSRIQTPDLYSKWPQLESEAGGGGQKKEIRNRDRDG